MHTPRHTSVLPMQWALVAACLAIAAPAAQAGQDKNGRDLNGRDLNGRDLNGRDLNGRDLNGTTISSLWIYDTKLYAYVSGVGWRGYSGSDLVGTNMQALDPTGHDYATDLEIWAYAGTAPNKGSINNSDVHVYKVSAEYWQWGCQHYGYVQGLPLDSKCSNVEGAVCGRDSYCCTRRWDNICVNEFWDEYSARGGAWYYYWFRHNERSVCGYDGVPDGYGPWPSEKDSKALGAVFVKNRWNTDEGYPWGGDKIYDGSITIACRKRGAIAKCLEDGYKPWRSSQDDQAHQACVRMMRADFCGDGTSWTETGHPVNLWDRYGYQSDTESWNQEAVWGSNGADIIYHINARRMTSVEASDGMELADYVAYKRAHYGDAGCPITGWGGCSTATCVDSSCSQTCQEYAVGDPLLSSEIP